MKKTDSSYMSAEDLVVFPEIRQRALNVIKQIEAGGFDTGVFREAVVHAAECGETGFSDFLEAASRMVQEGSFSEEFLKSCRLVLKLAGENDFLRFLNITRALINLKENPASFYGFVCDVVSRDPERLAEDIAGMEEMVGRGNIKEFQKISAKLADACKEMVEEKQLVSKVDFSLRRVLSGRYGDADDDSPPSPFDRDFFTFFYEHLLRLLKGEEGMGKKITEELEKKISDIKNAGAARSENKETEQPQTTTLLPRFDQLA